MTLAVECRDLRKSFKKVMALENINLSLEENKIYGLLGRNGAGKTTLLNLISCQIMRDCGDINVLGEEVFENTRALENICFVREKELPVEDQRVSRIFKNASILYKNWDECYKDFLIKEFNLDVRKKYKNLSRGMKSLLGVIIGLASRARIVLFDEPSLGLDAAVRDKFYSLLLEDYEKNKRTIILSTHLIDEVSNLFEEVIILHEGKVQVKEELPVLLDRAHFLSGREEGIAPFIKDKRILHREVFGSTSIVGVLGDFSISEFEELKSNNVDISPMSLQKLFIYLTERSSVQGVE